MSHHSAAEIRGAGQQTAHQISGDEARIHLGNEIGTELLSTFYKRHGEALITQVIEQQQQMDKNGKLYKEGKLAGTLDINKLGLSEEEILQVRDYFDEKIVQHEATFQATAPWLKNTVYKHFMLNMHSKYGYAEQLNPLTIKQEQVAFYNKFEHHLRAEPPCREAFEKMGFGENAYGIVEVAYNAPPLPMTERPAFPYEGIAERSEAHARQMASHRQRALASKGSGFNTTPGGSA